MAVGSTKSAGINVPEIVAGLMEVERQPLKKIQTQVDQKTVVISTLGVFKGKVSALESAARALQTPGGFSARSTSSSDSAKVSATASSAATVGAYTVKVAQTAQAHSLAVSGFSATNQVLNLTDFSVKAAGVTFKPEYVAIQGAEEFSEGDEIVFTLNGGEEQTFTVAQDSTAAEVAAAINQEVAELGLSGVVARVNSDGWLQLNSLNPIQGLGSLSLDPAIVGVTIQGSTEGMPQTATIQDLQDYINRLPAKLDAKLVQISSGAFTLSVSSELMGAENEIELSSLATMPGPVDSLALGGTFKVGNVITLTVNGTQIGYAIKAEDLGDDVSSSQVYTRIATALAKAVNEDPDLAGVQAYSSDKGLVLRGASTVTVGVDDSGASSTGAAALTRVTAADVISTTYNISELQKPRDAVFSVNGIGVIRASNTINDVIAGVTFSLNSSRVPMDGLSEDPITAIDEDTFSSDNVYSAVINVSPSAADSSASAVEGFVAAYNDLIAFYRTESVASAKADERGVLNNDGTLRGFMDQLRSLYNKGIRLADGSIISFSSLGVQARRDGSLLLDAAELKTAVADGLQEKLAEGVVLGYAVGSTTNFTSFLTRSLRSSGMITTHINDATSDQNRLQSRIIEIEDKLTRVERRYYRQYAALDALLFRLQNTSNALTSAIESLVNSQRNN